MSKAVTLLGMSGAGKTHFSQRLAGWGWTHYSNDYEIAKLLGVDASVEDLSPLSDFIGQLGNPEKGGLTLEEFKARQKAYYDAECQVLEGMGDVIGDAHFANDSTGSFCEVTDEALIARVAEKSLFVYIEADLKSHDEIIARAQEYPKPLFFPPAKLDEWLDAFCEEKMVGPTRIEPGDFSRWVFPKLFKSRLPKYERLAEMYGIKVSVADLHGCADEVAFLELIGGR